MFCPAICAIRLRPISIRWFGRHLADLHVVGADEVRRQVREVAIEQKIRRPLVAKLVKVAQIRLAGGDQQNIDAAAQQRADLLPLDLRILFRRGQDHRAVALPAELR